MKYSVFALPLVAVKRLWLVIKHRFYLRMKSALLAKIWRFECGKSVKFIGGTIIRTYRRNAIRIGNNVVFNADKNRNPIGLSGPTILVSMGGGIEIGDNSGFSSVVINSRAHIKIGSYVKVGGNVRIFDHDFHPLDWNDRRPPENGDATRSAPVVIEDDVFIGTNAIILKGTHVGAKSIIAAGSVVFGLDIPPGSIVKGNPAIVTSWRRDA